MLITVAGFNFTKLSMLWLQYQKVTIPEDYNKMMANISSAVTLGIYYYCFAYDHANVGQVIAGIHRSMIYLLSSIIIANSIGRIFVSQFCDNDIRKHNVKTIMTLVQITALSFMTLILMTFPVGSLDIYINIIPMLSLIEIAVMYHCILKVANYVDADSMRDSFRAL